MNLNMNMAQPKIGKFFFHFFFSLFHSYSVRFRDGTVHNIVARLTGLPDSEFQDVILFSYSAVIQPRNLWESMRDRYLTLSELEDKTGEVIEKEEMIDCFDFFPLILLFVIRIEIHLVLDSYFPSSCN